MRSARLCNLNQRLLSNRGMMEQDATPDAFSIFVSSVMVPPIRTAVTNSWEPRNPEHLIRLVEFWEHLWPHQVLNHVIMGLVFPKLRALVEVWEPRNEVIAIHVWLHPWLPYLGDLMKDLYPTIIFRLSTALQVKPPNSHLADASSSNAGNCLRFQKHSCWK